MIEGSCLCGEVRYSIDGEITDVSHCHCGMCRKIHGAAFGTYGAVRRDQLEWRLGENRLAVYRSSAEMERWFCGRCGSTLTCVLDDEPEIVYITLGTVDGDPGCRPASHIWVGSMAPWHTIEDGLRQFEESDG